jgi:hypothetical protein
MVRSGTTFYTFVDGAKQSPSQTSSVSCNTSGVLYIGVGAGYNFTGYIDEFRVSKGIARWVDDFTVPNDEYGQVVIANSQKKFGTGSAYFNGDGPCLTVPASNEWAFGTDNFTLECWVKFSSIATDECLIECNTDASNNCWHFRYDGINKELIIYRYTGSVFTISVSTPFNPSTNAWYHLAVERKALNNNSSDIAFFIDGVMKTGTDLTLEAGAWNGTFTPLVTSLLRIGDNFSGATPLVGWIDELRISKGIARWTTNFTPPNSEYKDMDILDSSTKLLIHFNGADGSMANYTAETGQVVSMGTTLGNTAQLDTTQKKFGTASLLLASGDYVSIPDSDNWTYGTGDFTIDYWVMMDDLPGVGTYQVLYYHNNGVDKAVKSDILNNLGTYQLRFQTAPDVCNVVATITPSPSADTWYHIAYVVHSSRAYVYWNGTLLNAGGTATGDFPDVDAVLKFGLNGVAGVTTWIDEIRITNGAALWTENFVPPSAPYGELMHISTDQKKYGTGSALFNGLHSTLSAPDRGDWDINTGDYTIDTWARFNSIPPSGTKQVLASQYSSGTHFWEYSILNNAGIYQSQFLFYSGTTQTIAANMSGLATDTWYHLAMSKSGDDYYFFQNGIQVGSEQTNTRSVDPVGGELMIGALNHTSVFDGYLDEVRITKGSARWTDNFTPPASAIGALPSFNIQRGCDKTHIWCSGLSNLINFGGFNTVPEEMVIR